MTFTTFNRLARKLFLLGGAVAGTCITAQAAAYTWNGTGNTNTTNGWGVTTDWNSNGIPGSSDTITFNGTGTTTGTVTLGASRSINGISVSTGETGATTFTSGGTSGYTLTTGSGGITQAASTGTLTLGSTTAANNFTVVLGSSTNTQTWSNASTGTMTVDAGMNGNSATMTQTLSTSGPIALTGNIGDGLSAADDNVALAVGGGSLTLSGTNAFTGGVTLNSGTLSLNSASALGAGTFTINGGSLDSNAVPGPFTETPGAINVSGSFSYVGDSHSLDLNAPTTFTNSDTITTNGGVNLYFGGNISFAATTNTLTKAGSQALIFGNYSAGGVTAGGTWSGSSGNTLTISAGSLEFDLATGATVANNIVNNGTATSSLQGIESAGATNTFTGNITGTDATSFDQTGTGTSVLAGALTGTVTLGAGTIQLGNGTSSATLSALPAIISGTTLAFDQTTGTVISSNLSDAGTVAGVEGSGITNTLSGVISGGGGFAQTGLGTTVFSGSNTYSGATTVSAGTLVLTTAATSTETGATTVNNGGTLQLQNANALQYSALTLSGGSTLKLRDSTATNNTTTTFTTSSIATATAGGTFNFDVNNLSTGTGSMLTLGNLTFGNNTSNQINVTGGTSSILSLGAVSAPSSSSGPYLDTINATTAAVNLASFTAGAYGTTLVLEGGNNITFGSSATTSTTDTLASSSSGNFTVSVNGAIVTIYGKYDNTSGSGGVRTLTLNSGQINFDSVNASGGNGFNNGTPITFTINGGSIDNTSGGSLTEAGNNPVNLAGSVAFIGSSSLNFGTGAVTVTGSNTITVDANTLTLGATSVGANTLTEAGSGTLTLGGTTLAGGALAATGTGVWNAGGLTAAGAGNFVSNSGSGTLALGAFPNLTTPTGGSVDINVTGGKITTSSSNQTSGVLSVYETVGGGADFAAVGGSGVIEAENTRIAESALTASGTGSNGNVAYLTGSLTLTAGASPSVLRINDTGTTDVLNLQGNNLNIGAGAGTGILYNGGATGQYLISGTGTVGSNTHTFNINTYAGTLTVSAPLYNDGSGAYTKGGAGTLVLNGTETYLDPFTVGGGTLDLGDGTNGSFATTGAITIASGATLGIGFANGGTLAASIADTGAIVGNEAAGVTNTISGSINPSVSSVTGGFTQTGAGTTVLSAANFYLGATNINAGAVEITNAGALGAVHHTSGVTVASGAALQMSGGITTSGAYALTINGTGLASESTPTGALESLSGANVYTGAVTLGSNASVGADASSSLTLSGTVNNAGNLLTVAGAGNTTFSGVVSGSGGLSQTGTGTTTLSATASNTYTGETIVSSGELDLNSGGFAIQGLGADTVATAPDILVNGGTLKFLASNQLANSSGSGNVTLSLTSGTVNLNGTTQTVYAFQNSGGTFSTGTGHLIGTGATTTFSGGTNTINAGGTMEDSHFVISGGTNVVQGGSPSGGTLELDPSGLGIVFSNGANLTLNSDTTSAGQISLNAGFGGTFNISSTAASTTASITSAGTAANAGTINLNGATANISTAAGTVAGGGPDLAISAVIADGSSSGSSVNKTGGGILLLSAANTYTGATTVSAGTLNVTGSIASSAVAVSSGATLGGTGSTGAVSLASGANINLQDSKIGTLTVAGLSTTGGGSGALTFEIGANSAGSIDKIADTASGSLSIGAGTTIDIVNLGGGTTGQTLATGSYTLLTYTGSAAGLANLALAYTTLDGDTLSLSTSTAGSVILNVAASATNGQYTLTTTAASLNVHGGGGTTTLATTIANTGTGTQDKLNYSGLTATTGSGTVGTASGNTSGTNLAQGANNSPGASQTFTGGSAGNVTVGNAATVSNASAAGTPVGTSIGTTINVYSGQSTWNTNGSGSWGTLTGTGTEAFGANWGANQGSPGLDPNFKGVDTATFGAQAVGSATVSLNAAAPNLNGITFSSPATSYTLAQGSGGNSITLSQGAGAALPGINVTTSATAGAQTISAPLILGSNTSLNVGANQSLTLSGAISSTGTTGLNNVGAGTTVLSNAAGNSYTGPTAITAGKFYVTNTSGSGTGSGAVSVSGSGSLLGGNGRISGAVTLSSGGSLYSGGVASGTPTTGTGSGLTLSSALNINGGNLTFALSAGSAKPTASFTNPNLTTTYLTTTSTVNFTGSDSISLVDLSNGTLTLRTGAPYLLIQAGSTPGLLSDDSLYSGLVTQNGSGALSMDGNGYVLGVYNGSGALTNYTALTINQYGADGVTPLTASQTYAAPALYLNNGDLEMVPEPGTWALMLGGLALLVVIQRRRNKLD
jgi:fibronectin-binding autotransporter adhesin